MRVYKSYSFVLIVSIVLVLNIPSVFSETTEDIQTNSAIAVPLGQTEYELFYDYYERIDALTNNRYNYYVSPYHLDNDNYTAKLPITLKSKSPYDVSLFAFGAERIRSEKGLTSHGFEKLSGGIAANPNDKLFIYGSFVLDEALANDINYHGKVWRGFAGDITDAYINYRSKRLTVTAGRFASFWGIRNSLIFSEKQKLDGLQYSFRFGRLTISYRLARLDGLTPDRDSVEQFENRYLAAHRLDFHLRKNLRLGAFETVLFGGPGRQIEFQYLNPLIFFHGSQLNDGSNDNTTVGLDFTYKPFHGIKLYGQLLIDDIQIDNKTASDKEPNQIAFLIGSYLANKLKGIDFKLEYSRVDNRTFNQILPRNRYTNNNNPIGSALGNDYDLIDFSIIKWFSPRTRSAIGIDYLRQGEGSVLDTWTEPWLTSNGDYTETFPTGVVEKSITLSLRLQTFVLNNIYIDLESGSRFIKNDEHQSGENRTRPFISLNLSAFVSSHLNLE